MSQKIMMLLADLYRLLAALLDWRGLVRVLLGQPRYDVACISNFESPDQMPFMGLNLLGRVVVNGLRFSLRGRLGRFLLIRSSARDLERQEGRDVAKRQVREAINRAARDGARIVLFGAGTKRLLDRRELEAMRRDYPDLVFTIGDHGTAWALQQDVFGAIRRRGLDRSARIVVIGPNGFLGGVVTRALRTAGYHDLVPVSSRGERPFSGVRGARLVVACSHHRRVRLTAEVLDSIGHPDGVQVVDVCKPSNLGRRELSACSIGVERQDAGNTHNPDLRYVFAPGARVVLSRLRLSLDRLYGCFSEAMAVSALSPHQLQRYELLAINDAALELIGRLMPAEGFTASPRCCFGTPVDDSCLPEVAEVQGGGVMAERAAA